MSKLIYYDRRFLKVDGYYLPLVQIGSRENRTENSEGRIVREKMWAVYNPGYTDKFLFTENEIATICKEQGVRKDCYKSKNSYHEDFERWLLAGLKSSMPLERAVELGNTLSMLIYDQNTLTESHSIASTDELYFLLNEFNGRDICIVFDVREFIPERVPKANFDLSKGYYVLKNEKYSIFVQKMSNNSVCMVKKYEEARKFKTINSALKYGDKVNQIVGDNYHPYFVLGIED